MLRRAFPCLCLSLGGLLTAVPLHAQDVAAETVIPQENVRFDYAQVLEVSPVYQTLRTTRMERVCDAKQESDGKIAQVVSAVKNKLAGVTREEREAGLSNCRMAPVVREFRRTIAYDVDYVYRGSRFRTRMGSDPGNRLRIRISIMPAPLN